MYHFTNHDLYHPNPYQQQCSIYLEHSKTESVHNVPRNNNFEAILSQNVIPSKTDIPTNDSDTQNLTVKRENKKNLVQTKSAVDTSNFSIEERLVAAVWVHERKHTKNSMCQIKHNFRQRFGREPPAKNTLLVWERKLFSTGSVHDAPRSGRPISRLSHMDAVRASLCAAPALSVRARASALRVPRTTLTNMLVYDITNHTPSGNSGKKSSVSLTTQKNRKTVSQTEQSVGVDAETVPRTKRVPNT